MLEAVIGDVRVCMTLRPGFLAMSLLIGCLACSMSLVVVERLLCSNFCDKFGPFCIKSARTFRTVNAPITSHPSDSRSVLQAGHSSPSSSPLHIISHRMSHTSQPPAEIITKQIILYSDQNQLSSRSGTFSKTAFHSHYSCDKIRKPRSRMKFTTAVALLSLFTSSSTTTAFLSRSQNAFSRPSSLTIVESTLASDTSDTQVHGDDTENYGALSMQIDELAKILGGRGRAQIVWDCYSIVSSRRTARVTIDWMAHRYDHSQRKPISHFETSMHHCSLLTQLLQS